MNEPTIPNYRKRIQTEASTWFWLWGKWVEGIIPQPDKKEKSEAHKFGFRKSGLWWVSQRKKNAPWKDIERILMCLSSSKLFPHLIFLSINIVELNTRFGWLSSHGNSSILSCVSTCFTFRFLAIFGDINWAEVSVKSDGWKHES